VFQEGQLAVSFFISAYIHFIKGLHRYEDKYIRAHNRYYYRLCV
jgi:hypothetical protein